MVVEVVGDYADHATQGLLAETWVIDGHGQLLVFHLVHDADEGRVTAFRGDDCVPRVRERDGSGRRAGHADRLGNPGREEWPGTGDVFSHLARRPGVFALAAGSGLAFPLGRRLLEFCNVALERGDDVCLHRRNRCFCHEILSPGALMCGASLRDGSVGCYASCPPRRTRVRPRTRPARISAATAGTPASPVSTAIDSSRPCGLRSVASRCQTCSRVAIGHMAGSLPRRLTPRRMKGNTVVLTAVPPVRPETATAPPYFVVRRRELVVAPPTGSMAPAQRSL